MKKQRNYHSKSQTRLRNEREGYRIDDFNCFVDWDYYRKNDIAMNLEVEETIQELLEVLKPSDQRVLLTIFNEVTLDEFDNKKKVDRSFYLNALHGEGNWNDNQARNFNNALKRIRQKAIEIGIDRYYWFEGNTPSEPPVPPPTLVCHAQSNALKRGKLPSTTFRKLTGSIGNKEIESLHGEVIVYHWTKEQMEKYWS